MTHRVFICFCILSLGIVGCLPGTLEKAVEVEVTPTAPAKPPAIAELHLSLAKGAYPADGPIPLRMTVRAGKFDLLMPAVSVEGEGAFGGLIITDAAGDSNHAEIADFGEGPHKKPVARWKGGRLYSWRRSEIRSGYGCSAGGSSSALQPCPGGLHAPSLHELAGLSGISARSLAAGRRDGEGPLGDPAEQAFG